MDGGFSWNFFESNIFRMQNLSRLVGLSYNVEKENYENSRASTDPIEYFRDIFRIQKILESYILR